MQLILTHLFRPKWQHPRPEIRKKAIGNLDPAQDTDQTILQTVASDDQDLDIRCQAIKKINSADFLMQLSQKDMQPRIQQNTLSRLCELVCGQGASELSMARRLQLLDLLERTDYQLHIVLHGDCFEIRQEALLRIADQSALAQIINIADNRQLRQLAAEGITEPDRLQQLIRSCRQRDKGVYRILKSRLDQQRQDAAEQQAFEQAQEQICSALEKLAEESVAQHYGAKLQGLALQWQGLTQPPQAPFSNRFEKARAQCQLKADRYAEELAARDQQQAAVDEQQQLHQQLQQARRALETCGEALEQVSAELPQQQKRWQQLAAITAPKGDLNRQITDLFSRIELLIQCWQRYTELVPDLKAADTLEQLRTLTSQLAWPQDLSPPALIASKQKQLRRDSAVTQQPATQTATIDLSAQLEQLEAALDQGSLQRASDQIRPLREQQAQLTKSQNQLFRQLQARYQELQGWQKFALEPKLEQLCDDMAALAEETDLADTVCAERLQALQLQWKQLDGPQVPNALRQRFQLANDRVYGQCREYFDRQRQQRKQNLEQRQRLCDQLDELLANTDWPNADLKGLQQLNRQLRGDWRRYSPVERAPGKKLQKRFNRGLTRLDEQLNTLRCQNAEKKQALIDQIAALLAEPEAADNHAAAQKLQRRWKQIGPAEKTVETELWQQFSQTCEQLFSRHRETRSHLEKQAREAASAICESLESSDSTLPESVPRLRQRFAEQTAQLSDSRRLQQRFERALNRYQLCCQPRHPHWTLLNDIETTCRLIEKPLLEESTVGLDKVNTLQEALQQLPATWQESLNLRLTALKRVIEDPAELDVLTEQGDKRLRLLCIQLEILLNTPSPEEDQALRMEYQMSRLQDALQQDSSESPCIEAVIALRQQWLTVPFNSFYTELNKRFEQLLQRDCPELISESSNG